MAETPDLPLSEPPPVTAADEPATALASAEAAPEELAPEAVATGTALPVAELAASPIAAPPDPTPAGEPQVATTLEVAPLPAAEGGAAGGSEGGEWELLVGKVKDWLERADLPGRWDRLGGPLRGLGLLLALLLVLKLYVALLDTLDDLPMVPRLLQLVGLIVLVRFCLLRLTRSSDRAVILEDWKRRWEAFRGQ